MEYDTDSIRKHNEDLNTTLMFVRFHVPLISAHTLGPVCSLLSAPPSSLTSSRNSS